MKLSSRQTKIKPTTVSTLLVFFICRFVTYGHLVGDNSKKGEDVAELSTF